MGASLAAWAPGRSVSAEPLHAIANAWPGIVGPNVAANSCPREIAGNVLIVATRSNAWSQQLQFLSLHVLAGIRALPQGITIERLTFRTGMPPRSERRLAPSAAGGRKRRATDATPAPAHDMQDAFERLRLRMAAVVGATSVSCLRCNAPLELGPDARTGPGAAPLRCAPCAGTLVRERQISVQRIVYMAPWLTIEDLRDQLPDLGVAEFERARRHLLQRWWFVLERARRAGKVSASGLERHVGSSYVLLQSRLPPDRITPAVVRNLLGPELEKLLWPHSTP